MRDKQEVMWRGGPQAAEIVCRARRRLVPGSQNYYNWTDAEHYPRFLTSGKGPILHDPDGREYIDLYCGSGAVILGHGHPAQVAAIRRQLDFGPSVSLRHPIEVDIAEWLARRCPFAERTMFFKTGSEATHAALAAACRFTGRTQVLSFGYHGWLPPYPPGWPPCSQPEVIQPGFDLSAAEAAFRSGGHRIGAVVVSPDPAFLDGTFYTALAREARQVGAVFIMDEIKSGFRLRFPCLSVALGLDPDILLLSKAIANGFPVSVLTGKDEVLGDERYISLFSTFATETLSLVGTMACLETLEKGAYDDFHRASETVYRRLLEGLAGSQVQVVGESTFFRLALPEHEDGPVLARRLAQAGLLYHPFDCVLLSAAHANEAVLRRIPDTICEVLRDMGQLG